MPVDSRHKHKPHAKQRCHWCAFDYLRHKHTQSTSLTPQSQVAFVKLAAQALLPHTHSAQTQARVRVTCDSGHASRILKLQTKARCVLRHKLCKLHAKLAQSQVSFVQLVAQRMQATSTQRTVTGARVTCWTYATTSIGFYYLNRPNLGFSNHKQATSSRMRYLITT